MGPLPAPAGMDPNFFRSARTPRPAPRARGDGPYVQAILAAMANRSPRPRGWTLRRDQGQVLARPLPAPAGL